MVVHVKMAPVNKGLQLEISTLLRLILKHHKNKGLERGSCLACSITWLSEIGLDAKTFYTNFTKTVGPAENKMDE